MSNDKSDDSANCGDCVHCRVCGIFDDVDKANDKFRFTNDICSLARMCKFYNCDKVKE